MVHADDDLVGRVVLEVRIDRVGRNRIARVRRRPGAGDDRDRVRAREDLVRLGDAVAVQIDPRIPQRRRGDRIDGRGDAAVADLTVVARVVAVRYRLAVSLHVIRQADPRGEVVERDAGVGARQVDAWQEVRHERIRDDR